MFRSVKTYKEEHNMFRLLIQMLNDFLEPGSPNPIPEILYLYQMSATGRLPSENFYPRGIIMYMLRRHEEVKENVRSEPRFANSLRCRYYDDGRPRVYEFSNTMPFHNDVIIMNFLFLFYTKHGGFPPRMCELAMLMLFKYMIREPVDYDDTNEEDPMKLTLRRVVQSFQSVTLWMYNYMTEFSNFVRSVFPSSFPAMVGASNFPLILFRRIGLRSSYNYLLAVNLALRTVYKPNTSVLSLVRHRTQCCLWFNVYTEDMRIDICKKLGIVTNRNDMYVFAPTFQKHLIYYGMAKTMIRYAKYNQYRYRMRPLID